MKAIKNVINVILIKNNDFLATDVWAYLRLCTHDLIRPKRIKMSCEPAAYRPSYMGVLWRRGGVAAEAEVAAGHLPPHPTVKSGIDFGSFS